MSDRQGVRQTGSQTDRESDRQVTGSESLEHGADREVVRKTGSQSDRQVPGADRQGGDRQGVRQKGSWSRQTGWRQTGSQTDRHPEHKDRQPEQTDMGGGTTGTSCYLCVAVVVSDGRGGVLPWKLGLIDHNTPSVIDKDRHPLPHITCVTL